MKFVTYASQGKDIPGVLSQDGTFVSPLQEMGFDYSSLLELIERYSPSLQEEIQERLTRQSIGIPLENVSLVAPIPYPKHDIICVGHNYLEHAKESMRFRGQEYVPLKNPTYFGKRVDRALGHGEVIRSHNDITHMLDYESELTVVIGKTCDHVKKEDVYSHIFGYTIVNDFSARDLQNNRGGQFFFGKSLDGFTPMGPCIATADEFSLPLHLQVMSRVNGEERQNGNTNDFIFDIPTLIEELSRGIVLVPGDMIATGTPSGVAMGFDPPKFLQSGDIIECEIEGIGILQNRID